MYSFGNFQWLINRPKTLAAEASEKADYVIFCYRQLKNVQETQKLPQTIPNLYHEKTSPKDLNIRNFGYRTRNAQGIIPHMYMSDAHLSQASAAPPVRAAQTYTGQPRQARLGAGCARRARACAHILHTERARCCVWWHGATIEGHIWANPDDCTIVLESSCHKVHKDCYDKKRWNISSYASAAMLLRLCCGSYAMAAMLGQLCCGSCARAVRLEQLCQGS